eukprot:15447419-Alexandrium_andersonii.AAC.1
MSNSEGQKLLGRPTISNTFRSYYSRPGSDDWAPAIGARLGIVARSCFPPPALSARMCWKNWLWTPPAFSGAQLPRYSPQAQPSPMRMQCAQSKFNRF